MMKFKSCIDVEETKTVLKKNHFNWMFFHTRKFDHCANVFASGAKSGPTFVEVP